MVQPSLVPWKPLIHLRIHTIQHAPLRVHRLVHNHRDVRRKRIGLLEAVREVEKYRVLAQGRNVWTKRRNRDHVGGVLEDLGRVPVIGVVVVGPVGDNGVRLEFADNLNDPFAIVEGGQQLSVVIVQE